MGRIARSYPQESTPFSRENWNTYTGGTVVTEFVPRQQVKFIGGPLDGVAQVVGTIHEFSGGFRCFARLEDSRSLFPSNVYEVEYGLHRLAYRTRTFEHRYEWQRGTWVHVGTVKHGA